MNNTEETKIPAEFSKVIKDLVRDIKETFPEVIGLINKWWKEPVDFEYIDEVTEREIAFEESRKTSIQFLFTFVKRSFLQDFLKYCIKMMKCLRLILISTPNFYHIFILKIYGNLIFLKRHVIQFGNIYN